MIEYPDSQRDTWNKVLPLRYDANNICVPQRTNAFGSYAGELRKHGKVSRKRTHMTRCFLTPVIKKGICAVKITTLLTICYFIAFYFSL